jgi:hypothetical protein
MLIQLFLFQSCKKYDWMNPHDVNFPKSLFTPSIPSAEMQGNSVKLTWTQENENISGFLLYKSSEQSAITLLAQLQNTTREYIDESVAAGMKYTYYILAVAGTNKSDTLKVAITPVFLPVVSSVTILDTSVDKISVEVTGEVINDGGSDIISRGICWSTNPSPTVSDSRISVGKGIGRFAFTLPSLQFATKYYVRAYAENSRGISYGQIVSFTTITSSGIQTNNNEAEGVIDLQRGLVAYYPFSGNANDNSGNGNHGNVNGPTLTTDRFGISNSAFSFTDNQFIDIVGSQDKNLYPLTINLWVSFDALNNKNGCLFRKYAPGAWNGFALAPSTSDRVNTGSIYPMYLSGGAIPNGLIGGYGLPETVFVINNIVTNTWVQITMTVDQTGGKLYLDGKLIDSLGWRTPAKACSNNYPWVIGGPWEGSGGFKGKIDDIRVYNRALSPDEIVYLANH